MPKETIELNSCWTGPVEGKDYGDGPIPPEEWPYGPPNFHQECCLLFKGKTYCDCRASASDGEEIDAD